MQAMATPLRGASSDGSSGLGSGPAGRKVDSTRAPGAAAVVATAAPTFWGRLSSSSRESAAGPAGAKAETSSATHRPSVGGEQEAQPQLKKTSSAKGSGSNSDATSRGGASSEASSSASQLKKALSGRPGSSEASTPALTPRLAGSAGGAAPAEGVAPAAVEEELKVVSRATSFSARLLPKWLQ